MHTTFDKVADEMNETKALYNISPIHKKKTYHEHRATITVSSERHNTHVCVSFSLLAVCVFYECRAFLIVYIVECDGYY